MRIQPMQPSRAIRAIGEDARRAAPLRNPWRGREGRSGPCIPRSTQPPGPRVKAGRGAADRAVAICRTGRGVLALALLLATAAAAPAVGEAGGDPEPAWVDGFAPRSAPPLDEADLARLEDGEVLVRDLPTSDGEGIGVALVGLVDAPPERVWEVMADCDAQDEFLPRITHAEVRDRDGDAHTCELVLDMPFPMDDARTTTRQHVRRLPDGGYQRRWALSEESASYRRNRGSWSVHPHPDGRTLLVSRMELVPKFAVPLWLMRAAQHRQAPRTIEAIRERVRAVASTE